jgi:amino acid transporter
VATVSSTAPRGTDGRPAPARLARGVLTNFDISAATLANIAPAMSFFFGFALIVETAGVAAPLTVIVAAIAIALLGNTLTQFSRSRPSTGSFVTFIGRAFGGYSAVVAAVVLGAGYILAVSSVVAISGGWTETIIQHYLSITIPWQIFTAILTGAALYLIISGAKPSTTIAAVFFAFEAVLLVVISIALLVQHSGSISLKPFDPSQLNRGFSGLSLGFPLAVYLFIGWENSAAMAEETKDPRTAVPKAVFTSIALIAVLIAGFTSIFGTLISATNSQARIIFNSGREGLLPSVTGRVTARTHTPWVAFLVFLGLALGITYVFCRSSNPDGVVVFFGEIATLGTILVAFTYLVANLALPVYFRRYHSDRFNPLTHLILPLAGAVAIGYPLYELVKPGQPAPFNAYVWIALGIVAVALVWAGIVYSRDPKLGERVGSIVADAE